MAKSLVVGIQNVLKRPGANVPVVKKTQKKTAPEIPNNHIVWEGSGKPPVPKLGDVIIYKLSKIYVSTSRQSFRVIVEAKNYASEKGVKWGAAAPTKET